MTISRRAAAEVERGLAEQAAVLLTGPRQVGKTTLALELANHRPAEYLDLQLPADRRLLAEPEEYLERFSDRLVILDEVQNAPELFQVLRALIDRGRREGRGIGRFLLTGSASVQLLNQSESLAGRVSYVEMTPISALEVVNDRPTRDRLWLRGGYPLSFLAESDALSSRRRSEIIRSTLSRDIQEFSPRVPLTTIDDFVFTLATRQGSTQNSADLGRAINHSPQTANRYVDLLRDFLLVRPLRPYFINIGKRLAKSPKLYLRDSGLLHTLLRIETMEQLAQSPIYGMSWEGFVVETLVSGLPWPTQAFFYRTATGAEIDLVIEFPSQELWAIEIKRSVEARLARGFHQAREDLKPARSLLVHGGDDRFSLGQGIEAIGLVELAHELRSHGNS